MSATCSIPRPIAPAPDARRLAPRPDAAAGRLDGEAKHQIASVWEYLLDGGKGGLPRGLIRNPIELEPRDEPIIYRNFITGVSPRGVAVGYPQKANLAFDADPNGTETDLAQRFIDAAKHWNGRGQGFQPPLGDHLGTLPGGVPFASLETLETNWPTDAGPQTGVRFRGYPIDKSDVRSSVPVREHPGRRRSAAGQDRQGSEAGAFAETRTGRGCPGKTPLVPRCRLTTIVKQKDGTFLVGRS
ncbi:MAG: hypothetical protein Ct9H300mP1_23340 [Planctomycetaceae bacterium]|nr:MAG: hypothetical protein Ct9H300mP1_23340 [Planctomycetaceae bacterium]